MPALALAMYALYLFAAFVVRAAIQWRRTGDTGMCLGTEPVGSPQWWSRVAFVAALVAGALAPVLALAGVHGPVGAFDHPGVAVLGAVIAGVGIVATFVAQVAMGSSWRVGVDPGERTDLVVRWPFTLVRNPIFTAMDTAAVGFALLVPSPLAIAATVLLILAVRHQVRTVEEPYLQRVHGDRYGEYAARVGRFLPGIGRLDPPATYIQ